MRDHPAVAATICFLLSHCVVIVIVFPDVLHAILGGLISGLLVGSLYDLCV
jgi:uncharacterized membrane protein YdjX (TVP38/TMEM64 family)